MEYSNIQNLKHIFKTLKMTATVHRISLCTVPKRVRDGNGYQVVLHLELQKTINTQTTLELYPLGN